MVITGVGTNPQTINMVAGYAANLTSAIATTGKAEENNNTGTPAATLGNMTNTGPGMAMLAKLIETGMVRGVDLGAQGLMVDIKG